MSAGQLRMPGMFAWVFFAPAAVFIVTDIVRLQITGLFLLGVVFLAIWLWLIGAFTHDFWFADIGPSHPAALGSLDLADRAAWGRAEHYFDPAAGDVDERGVAPTAD